MQVISETAERTITTPAAAMSGLAGPSQGSTALSTWRVAMNAGPNSPEHVVSAEQVWMVTDGVFEFLVDGDLARVTAGQAVIVPAGATRRFRAVDGDAGAFVAMPADGQVGVPGGEGFTPIPWAV